MRRTILALVAALLLTAVPVPAVAGGGDKGDWELGVYGGYAWLDDYGQFHPKDDWLFGARAGYFFTSRWNLEVSAQQISTKTDFDPGLGLNNADVDLDSLRLNVLYNFRPGMEVRPFVTVGGGCEKFDGHSYGESCDLGYNAGGGLRWFVTPNLNLRLDGRYVRTHVGAGLNETEGNIEATVGIGFLIGGTHEAMPCPDCPPPPPKMAPCPSCPACPQQQKAAPCPPPIIQQLLEKKAVILEGVEFDNDRDTLRPASLTTLDEVASSLKDWPFIRVEIQGHCSEVGTEAHNLELSDRRAAAVRAYLISRGIDSSRLESRGFGESRPIASNTTEEGRQKNRRVELHRID
ncbi:MAG TPA: OmpA family protein [Candidatus Polarisedimenticolia bacterium]